MSGYSTGGVFPTWEQLLHGIGSSSPGRPGYQPRHVRTWVGPPDETMSWAEAAGWSAIAVSCALAVSRWAPHLLA